MPKIYHRKHGRSARSHARCFERRTNDEAGYTLVELLIYSSLLVLILTVVGGILLNAMKSEQEVIASADANGVSQLIASSISSGMRNATEIDVPGSAHGPNDQFLVLNTVSSDPDKTADDHVCQAWYYTEAKGGALYYQREATPEAINATSPTNLSGWTLLGSGLTRTGQPIFSAADTVTPAITLNFAITADGDGTPALISTTFKTRQGPSTETAQCFETE